MSTLPTLQATLNHALENAALTVEYLRGCVQFASPVEAIVIMGLLADAINVAQRLEELTTAVRMEYTEPEPAIKPTTKTRINDAVGLTHRTKIVLMSENILYMEDAQALGEQRLLRTPNMGKKATAEILSWSKP